ncbi:MAG: sigma-70 family RNA polymerase sigma factor [Clostridia bacterium]|nr:sigma-70 family RNA polymerase sigma factor [Clostridia bacterium]
MFNGILSLFSSFIHFILGVSTPQSYPPPLNAKEEARLFTEKENGSNSAREKLILHNLRLVSHIVRKYYSTARNQEDLISIGTLGLVKAVDTFKRSGGARFATYASKCIQNEILMHFRSQKKLTYEVSLNDVIDVDRDGNPLTYLDVVSSDECLELEIMRKCTGDKALKIVSKVLTPREKRIIFMRFGINGRKPMTQKRVAEVLGISRSYVSRIEKTALNKIKNAFN